jgi:hypothetical protein
VNSSEPSLQHRVADLERRLRRMQTVALFAALATMGLALTAFVKRAPTPDVVRTRQLIIEDSAGRDRIVLGAPMRDNFQRMSPATGLAIRDTAGNERFGLSLKNNGDVSMGFDAPRCTSTPCNPERINIGAFADGSAQIRFLDSQTGVAARMELAADDRVHLRFMKVTRDSIRARSLSIQGDTTVASARSR